jgi:GAF domain-containing protein
MLKAPIQDNEDKRLRALKNLNILDTNPEERFDKITKKVVKRFKVPISTISIIDSDREWFKSCQGLNNSEGKREISFCGHAMYADYVFIVEDTLEDERFKDNPYVIGPPYIRFYAGVSLHESKSDFQIGVLCMKDFQPRKFSSEDLDDFLKLANEAEVELNMF